MNHRSKGIEAVLIYDVGGGWDNWKEVRVVSCLLLLLLLVLLLLLLGGVGGANVALLPAVLVAVDPGLLVGLVLGCNRVRMCAEEDCDDAGRTLPGDVVLGDGGELLDELGGELLGGLVHGPSGNPAFERKEIEVRRNENEDEIRKERGGEESHPWRRTG